MVADMGEPLLLLAGSNAFFVYYPESYPASSSITLVLVICHRSNNMTEEYFRSQFETNFFGLLHVTRAALPVMRKQRSGHIIQISSIRGRIGTPGLGAYQASKWAVGGMSEVLAREVKHLGIKVTVLEPGGMATEFASKSATFGDIGDDYQESVGMMVNMMSKMGEGLMVDDLAKVAQLDMQVADMDEPPLHLLVGSDAFFVGQE